MSVEHVNELNHFTAPWFIRQPPPIEERVLQTEQNQEFNTAKQPRG